MDNETAKKIFNQVKDTYNEIAKEFSATRDSNWQEVESLAGLAKKNERVLDLGCGNGRLSELLEEGIDYFGIDNSEKLIAIAQSKYPQKEFKASDGQKIPFKKYTFDKVYCIAVLHHVPGRQMRQRFLKEAKRVLKPGGQLILTVWLAKNYPKAKRELGRQKLKYFLGLSKMGKKDVILPWGKSKLPRYIHFFSKSELEKEVQKTGLEIKESGFLSRRKKECNIFVIAQK